MIVVSGVGCISALGDTPAAVFDALCAGRSGIDDFGPFPGKGPVASIPGGPHLTSDLALHACRQALGGKTGRIGVVGATTSGDMVRGEIAYEATLNGAEATADFIWPQLADRPTQRVAAELGLTGPRVSISTACSSGAAAVGIAADWVRSGRVDRALAFGADALCRMTVHGFGSLGAISPTGARPFDPERTGLSLGEGAGALLIERAETAENKLAVVAGYGSAMDAHHMTAPDPEGSGARAAIEMAGTDEVGWVCAHGTATPLNDAMEAGVLAHPASSIKGALGHTLGAAGAVELVIAVMAVQQGRMPPNVGAQDSIYDGLVREVTPFSGGALSVNFAFGGHNAAVRLLPC